MIELPPYEIGISPLVKRTAKVIMNYIVCVSQCTCTCM